MFLYGESIKDLTCLPVSASTSWPWYNLPLWKRPYIPPRVTCLLSLPLTSTIAAVIVLSLVWYVGAPPNQ